MIAGFILLLIVGSVWSIHLVRHNDPTLARWASVSNIVGLPIAFVALLIGLIALLMQRSSSESDGGATQTAGNKSRQTIGRSDDRKVDRGSTYIEMTGGSISLAQPDRRSPNGASSPNERAEQLLFRAIKITSQGESQEVEIFDAELADKWIKRDPWGSASGAGEADDK